MPNLENLKFDLYKGESIQETNKVHEAARIMAMPDTIDEVQLYADIQMFAYDQRNANKMVEFTLFHKREPKLEGNVITFTLDNELQLIQLKAAKADLINYLREKNEINFLVEGVVSAEKSQEKIIYSASDKFQFLANEYPHLLELRKRLALEIDH
jgi:DNA polymerase-3 subunit gamma/tau